MDDFEDFQGHKDYVAAEREAIGLVMQNLETMDAPDEEAKALLAAVSSRHGDLTVGELMAMYVGAMRGIMRVATVAGQKLDVSALEILREAALAAARAEARDDDNP